ncbi:MAG: hypothetical protein PQJ46_01095 [Spirochaetales bacterium]|nr:hypothetical protein [Spirochaetales bacterium]
MVILCMLDKNNKKIKLWNSDFLRKGDVILAFILRGLFITSLIISIVRGRFDLIPISAVSFILTFIPSILERSIRVSLPASFQVVLLIFIFGAQFLGEIFDYYERFWWWDLLLHGWSGVLLGLVGFILVYILNEASDVGVVMSPFFVAFFAFCFAVTCGVVWEVFEYLMDIIFGTDMQKSGLQDTMGDLIIDTAGALIISVNGFFTLRDKKKNTLNNAISGFMKKNPDMEKRIEDQLHNQSKN